jgi:cullin-4
MKPSSSDSVATSPISPGKRKLHEQQQKSAVSQISRQTSSPSRTKVDIGITPVHSAVPAAKRLKTSHSSANIGRPADMNRSIGIVSRPGVIDLTLPSNFQPYAGAKKLVIKNLRTTSRQDLVEYYNKTWTELDDALTSLFEREEPAMPLEMLCRGVEATCRHGRAEKLFVHVKERCKSYLEKQLLPVLEEGGGPSNVDALRTVHKFWTIWNEQSVREYQARYIVETDG